MSNNWKTYKLGEACNITSSKRIFYNEYVKSGIPFYRSKEIILKSNLSEITNQLYISQDKFNEIKNKFGVPIEGDILLTAVGTIGIPYLVKETDLFYFKDGNLTWLKDLKEILSANFFIHWIKSNIGKEALKGITIGSTQSAITIQGLKNLEIKLPRRQEQQAIASILSDIDDKIENNLAINKTLEEMAMALYKHWFVDFGPFQDGEFVESELGMIPKGWEVRKFNELIDKIIDNRGKTPPLSNEKTDFLLLETYQLSRNNLFPVVVKDSKAKYVSEEIYNTSKWFRKGHPQFMDVLFATVGNGIPNWSFMYENNGVCIAQNIVALRPKKDISSIFLRYSFESKRFLEQFDGYVITTAQPSIKLSDLNRVNMIVPSNEVLNSWTDVVSNYVAKIYNHYKENRSLTELRDTLLPQLISGKVRLKEFQE